MCPGKDFIGSKNHLWPWSLVAPFVVVCYNVTQSIKGSQGQNKGSLLECLTRGWVLGDRGEGKLDFSPYNHRSQHSDSLSAPCENGPALGHAGLITQLAWCTPLCLPGDVQTQSTNPVMPPPAPKMDKWFPALARNSGVTDHTHTHQAASSLRQKLSDPL